MGKRVPSGITKLINKCIPGGVKIRRGIRRLGVLNIRFRKRATRKRDHYLERSCIQKKKVKDKRKACTNDIMRKKEIGKENIREWKNANEVVANSRRKNMTTEKRANDEQSDKKAKKICECPNAMQAAIVIEQLYKQRTDKRLEQQNYQITKKANETNRIDLLTSETARGKSDSNLRYGENNTKPIESSCKEIEMCKRMEAGRKESTKCPIAERHNRSGTTEQGITGIFLARMIYLPYDQPDYVLYLPVRSPIQSQSGESNKTQ
uniref:Uncharacterized protein n=1 Tax=Trichuris muris TaxID=70415 RepID=A0A5S6QPV8_TRIMR